MPSLRALGMERSPLADPASYPGAAPDGSALLAGNWLYPLAPGGAPSAGLPGWRPTVDGGPLAAGPLAAGTPASKQPSVVLPLDEALARLGVVGIAGRRPVLAVGSNASPAQLRHKFGDTVVPLVRGRATGLAVGHSAHVGAAGYLPYTPVAAAGPQAFAELVCLWLDDVQRRRLDATEPNYRPLVLDASRPFVLSSGEVVPAPLLYRSRWGALRLDPAAPPLAAGGQAAVYGRLGALAWFRELVPEHRAGSGAVAAALGADRERREGVRDRFAALGLAAPDGLDAAA